MDKEKNQKTEQKFPFPLKKSDKQNNKVENRDNFRKDKIYKIVTYSLIVLSLIFFALVLIITKSQDKDKSQIIETPRTIQKFNIGTEVDDDAVILRVGEEEIYQKDYNTIASSLPPPVDANKDRDSYVESTVIEKLITDSIILQEGEKQGYASLNDTIYNSFDKDYDKRLKVVDEVKKKVEEAATSLKGSYVALWFVNIEVGPLGYEQAKEKAFEKIQPLHEQVKSGKMTIKQAADAIINDPNMAQIDIAYQGNAYTEFAVKSFETISFSSEFNQLLRSLGTGGITDLYLAKDQTQDLGYIEAVYLFGQVDEKKNPEFASFEAWFNNARKKYEVVKE